MIAQLPNDLSEAVAGGFFECARYAPSVIGLGYDLFARAVSPQATPERVRAEIDALKAHAASGRKLACAGQSTSARI